MRFGDKALIAGQKPRFSRAGGTPPRLSSCAVGHSLFKHRAEQDFNASEFAATVVSVPYFEPVSVPAPDSAVPDVFTDFGSDSGIDATADSADDCRAAHAAEHRPLRAEATARPGRPGHRVRGLGPAAVAHGRGEDTAVRHRYARARVAGRAVPERGARGRRAEPLAHRHRARRGSVGARRVHRHGTAARARPAPGVAVGLAAQPGRSRAAGAARGRRAGLCARARRRALRHQAGQHLPDAPRPPQGAGLRHRPRGAPCGAAGARGRGGRVAALPGAGAAAGRQCRCAHRHLLARHGAVRTAHGAQGLRRRLARADPRCGGAAPSDAAARASRRGAAGAVGDHDACHGAPPRRALRQRRGHGAGAAPVAGRPAAAPERRRAEPAGRQRHPGRDHAGIADAKAHAPHRHRCRRAGCHRAARGVVHRRPARQRPA